MAAPCDTDPSHGESAFFVTRAATGDTRYLCQPCAQEATGGPVSFDPSPCEYDLEHGEATFYLVKPGSLERSAMCVACFLDLANAVAVSLAPPPEEEAAPIAKPPRHGRGAPGGAPRSRGRAHLAVHREPDPVVADEGEETPEAHDAAS